jgi:hypothetical protein
VAGPYDFDENSPADNDYISDFPSNERDARTAKKEAFEVDHELTDGYHDLVTLNEQAADPDNAAADKMSLYTKNDSGQPELFVQEESAGDVIQLTKAGAINGALSLLSGSPVLQRTLEAVAILANTIALQAKEAGGTARDVAKMTAGDVLQLGNTTTTTTEVLVNALSGLLARHAGGTARILTVDDEGSGNGLDADTVDGIERSDLLTWDSVTPVYKEINVGRLIGPSQWLNAAHGLGSRPRLWCVYYRLAAAADQGYVTGDEIPYGLDAGHDAGNNNKLTCWANATHVGTALHIMPTIKHKTGAGLTGMASNEWDIIFKCWK